jgi:hypothetical protein
LVLVVRLAVGQRLIPRRQTVLILSLVPSLQLVAEKVLAADLLAPLLVTAVLAEALVVILTVIQVAQASPDRALMGGNVLTLQLQRVEAEVVAQAQLAEQELPHKVVLAVLVQRLRTVVHR